MSSTRIIEDMISEIESRLETNKDELLSKYVSIRLESSLRNYYKDILDSYNSLIQHDGQHVLKQLGR